MKTSVKISYQVILVFLFAAAGIAAVLGFWLHAGQKAVPLQPAPVAERMAPADGVETAAADRQTQIRKHKVADGETLSQIAEIYQIDVDTIYGANQDISDVIHPGDELAILPRKGIIHTAQAGDTVWSLSNEYKVNADDIIAVNQLYNGFIVVGQQLFIPGGRLTRSAAGPSRAGVLRFLWPAAGEISSGFGYRWGRMHAGIDVAADTGTPVVAAKAGYIVYAGWWGGYGYTVMIEHGQGYSTLYAHLSDYVAAKGDYVAAGKLIGYVGNTGYSTGPHLHFEIRHHGEPINPFMLLP